MIGSWSLMAMRRSESTSVQAICIVLTMLLLLVAGCFGVSKQSNRKAYPVVIVAIDRSGSTDAFRESYKLASMAATAHTADNRSSLGFYAVDRKAISIDEPHRYEVGGLTASVQSELSSRQSQRSVGTRPLALWQEMTERFGNANTPVYIAFLTDGGNDFAGEHKLVTAALKQLSTNNNVHVALLGVNPELSTNARRDLQPFGERGLLTLQNGMASKEALRADLMRFIGGGK